jgi:Dephospho-CoA kinase
MGIIILSRIPMTDNHDLDTQMRAVAKIIGYKRMPPSIEEFIESPYYLGKVFGKGKLFPYWKKILKDIFPSPIHTKYLIITLTGAIGTGKSTLSKIIALYNKCRLDHLENLNFSGLANTKGIDFIFFHTSISKAQSDFIDSLDIIEKESPYFNGGRLSSLGLNYKCDGVRSNNAIGGDVIFYCLSELNFVPAEKAFYKLDQATKRFESRYQKLVGYFGNVIIDTSTRGDDTIVEQFIKDTPFKNVLTIRASIWEAKAHQNIYFRTGSFQVYTGDSTHAPFIVDDHHPITHEHDPKRVITAPMELYDDFKFNITSALQDKAGVSTKSTGKLFDNITDIEDSLVLPTYSDEVLSVDFYNKTDKLIYKMDPYLRKIPDSAVLFPRYDIGITNDFCGVAVTYFDKWKFFDIHGRIKQPTYITPIALALSRSVGQETSIFHLYEFILDLKERFEIGEFTADQFASTQLLQDLKREGVKTVKLSVDRDDKAYIYFKNMICNGLWRGPNSKLLLEEFWNLNWVDGKVDHPLKGCFVGETQVLCRSKLTGKISGISMLDLIVRHEEFQTPSYDGEFHWNNIEKVWLTKYTDTLTELEFSDGQIYRCTPDHLFLTASGYVEAQHVTEDSDLVNYYDSPETVRLLNASTVKSGALVPVYDIEVSSPQESFCLLNGCVSHNSKDIADAVSGSVYSCFNNLELATGLGPTKRDEARVEHLARRVLSPSDDFIRGSLFSGFG